MSGSKKKVPTEEECEEAIQQFAEITQTDEAFAHAMLQDENFDLDRALTKYYSTQTDERTAAVIATMSTDEVSTAMHLESQYKGVSAGPAKKRRFADQVPMEFSFLTWNIDGIDEANRKQRMTAVLYVIAKANPEVIFLQEMVDEMMPQLRQLMEPMYHIFVGKPEVEPQSVRNKVVYYCVTLVSRNIEVLNSEVIPFGNTIMTRGMIVIEATWQKLNLKLINTHLESMKDFSAQRKVQFGECVRKMGELTQESNPNNTLAIFAGDLNIRDDEVCPLPSSVRDAWMAAGSLEDRRYTWDMRKNDNHRTTFARCRFDRVYFSGAFRGVDFTMEGMQRIFGIGRFPSDHFAVCCRFHTPYEEPDWTTAAGRK